MTSEPDIPLDYQYVNWEHLQKHVGRAIIDGGVPLMNEKVAKYLNEQAKELRRTADRLEAAARAIHPKGVARTGTPLP